MDALHLLVVVCVLQIVDSQNPGWLERGENCQKEDGEPGICTQFFECTSAITEVSRNGRPKICSFDGKNPIVCCATNNSMISGQAITGQNSVNNGNVEKKNEHCRNQNGKGSCKSSNLTVNERNSFDKIRAKQLDANTYQPFDESSKSQKACRMYHTFVSIPPLGVIDGRNSNAKEFPHMAVLGYGNPENIHWQCGGTLISLQFVMTAAHCLYSKTQGHVRFVRLGELELHSTTDDADPQNFTVIQTYPHPDYRPRFRYNDIALVKLDRKVRVSDYVKPACLPVRSIIPNDSITTAIGWGLTSRGGSTANILQVGLLRLVPFERCKTIYGVAGDLRNGILDDLHLCAEGERNNTDTCQGDSGGPLQVENYEFEFGWFPEIVGVTSFGKDCGLTAGVYTRVYHYVPWIENIVFPGADSTIV